MQTGSEFFQQTARFAQVVYLGILASTLAFAIAPTTTTLTISPPGPVSTGTLLTLTTSVTSSGARVTRGLVLFCNAAAAHCEDTAIVGQAQLTSSGSATLKLRLGTGAHSIRAWFQGTKLLAASQSAAESLSVTDGHSSATVTVTGTAGAVTVTGTTNFFGAAAPAGTVSFLDAAHGNSLLGSAAIDGAATTSSFVPIQGNSPTAAPNFTVGDFNGDGIPDYAVPDSGTTLVWVYLGVGDGTFTVKSSTVSGNEPWVVGTGDFNGDGIADLAVFNLDDSAVSVLLGNGDGTFVKKSTVAAGTFGVGIVVADFNGDGTPDIGVLNYMDSTVTVLLGNGDGTFEYKSSPATGAYPIQIAVADLNGDGIPDLVTTNDDNTLTILLGHGDGTFTGQSLPSVENILAIATGDFNDDGIPDLVVTNYTDVDDGLIIVLLGKGDGTFVQKSMASVVAFPTQVVVGDFNADGETDIVTNGSNVNVFLGHGDGTFSSRIALPLGSEYQISIAAADLNGDGLSDILQGESTDLGWSVISFLTEKTSTVSINSPIPGGVYNIVASYSGDSNYAASTSPTFLLDLDPPANPVIIPPPGIYHWTQMVSLSDATPGATIHYTLDGTTPTASSPAYTSPLEISWDGTINAMAFAASGAYSHVSTGSYTVDRPLPSPTFSLSSGTYSTPQSITLTDDPTYCGQHGAVCEIYYTLNGTMPTTWGSTKYTGPITLESSGTVTIKAIAISHHYVASTVASETYRLQ